MRPKPSIPKMKNGKHILFRWHSMERTKSQKKIFVGTDVTKFLVLAVMEVEEVNGLRID